MLQVQGLRKDYGAATILSAISFILNDGEHVGLLGPNGVGKSTLLRCIAGSEQPDAGSISLTPRGAAIGYLAQSLDAAADTTLGAALAAAQADWSGAEAELQQTSQDLAGAGDLDAALAAYAAALERFEALGGYEREKRTAAVIEHLGLGVFAADTPVAVLSGGQKTRLGLALVLVREPQLLLLDEPTNHLDVAALEWLEGFVQSYPHAVLVVSHDRTFLDRTVQRVLYLDPATRTLHSYNGNYSDFAAARRHEHELHVATWKRQQEYIGRVAADIAHLKGRAQSVEGRSTPKDSPDDKWFLDQKSSARKVAQMARARERKLERYLDSDERVERPQREWGLRLDFGEPPPGGRAVLTLADVTFAYPGQPPLLEHVSFDVQHGERIALVGPNGAGKSTLVKLIAGQLQPAAGQLRLGANIRLGLLAQEQETLDLERTVLETALRERALTVAEARNFLHRFLFAGDSVFLPVGACSLGERTRLQLALLMLRGCNLLVLDEPLNHLDIEGREHFAAALDAFAGAVIVVAHDRAFLSAFAERTLVVAAGGVREQIAPLV